MVSLHITFVECMTYVIIGYVYKLVMIKSPAQQKDLQIFSKLVLQLIIPVYTFRIFVKVDKLPSESWIDMVVFAVLEVLSGLVGHFLFRRLDYAKWVTLYVTMFSYSTGVFFYPILDQIVGAESIANMIMFDIPNNIVMYVLFPLLFLYVKTKTAADEERPSKKEIAYKIFKLIVTNVMLMSIFISLICFAAGLKLPVWADDLLEKISSTLTFVGMTIMGMLLDLHPRLVLQNIKWVGLTMLAHFGVGAVVAVFNYFVVFPHVSPATRVIIFLGPFMPPPIAAGVFTIDNGYDPFLTGLVINTSTVVSFFIIWILFTSVNFGDDVSSSLVYSALFNESSY